MKRITVALLKFAVPLAIFVWLVYRVQHQDPDTFRQLWYGPKNWPRMVLALAACVVGVSLTFTRWCLLVRALGMRFAWRDAFRLGFISYLLNFVSLGAVGGDLFKAVLIAREQPGRRPEAVASILVDRIVGLFTLLLLSSLGFALLAEIRGDGALHQIAYWTWGSSAVGSVLFVCFLSGGISLRWLAHYVTAVPAVQNAMLRVDDGLRLYRNHWAKLLVAIVMGLGTHCFQGLCIFLLATALLPSYPSLTEHWIMWPVAGAVSAIPVTPAGMGTFELTLSSLYQSVPAVPLTQASGLMVALSYRAITIAVAGVGLVVFWASRREVMDAVHEAEQVSVEPRGESQSTQRSPAGQAACDT